MHSGGKFYCKYKKILLQCKWYKDWCKDIRYKSYSVFITSWEVSAAVNMRNKTLTKNVIKFKTTFAQHY